MIFVLYSCQISRRKSLSGNWKTNIGQSILEEIPVTDRYKSWIDGLSEIFGGLDICSLEALVSKEGKEYIIEVNDSATTLMGESQEEDRKNIAEIVLKQMEVAFKKLLNGTYHTNYTIRIRRFILSIRKKIRYLLSGLCKR